MIVNLTQHTATPEQVAQGVVDLNDEVRNALVAALTFDDLPTLAEIEDAADVVAELACQNGIAGDDGDSPWPGAAMIGGAPFLMAPREAALRSRGIEPVYAFSRRESVESIKPDGSVIKTNVFRHVGFVSAEKQALIK